jgi:hypothetical protein
MSLVAHTLEAESILMGGPRYAPTAHTQCTDLHAVGALFSPWRVHCVVHRWAPWSHRYYHVAVDAHIRVHTLRAGTLNMAKSNGVLVEALESVLVANLSVGSGTRLRVERGPINVTRQISLSPHFYTRCPGDTDDVPAGSCEGVASPSECTSDACGWTSPPVCPCDPPYLNASTKVSQCYVRKKLCATAGGVPDLSCDWLLAYARTRCFVGPDGVNVFADKYNASQSCPPTVHAARIAQQSQ